jgi:predicted Zn-dependent protease
VKTLVLFLLACMASAQTLPPALAERYNQGVQAGKAGQLDAAEKAFLEVLAEGGKQALVYHSLGIVYHDRHEDERAVAQFREAIRLDPKFAPARALMGTSLLALGRYREAIPELETAVKLDPREPAPRVVLAQAYERLGNPAGMVEQYRQLRQAQPSDPEVAYQLARAYSRLAAHRIGEIRRIAPHSARLQEMLGENLVAQGRMPDALEAYAKAAAAAPKLPGIHFARAQIYLRLEKPQEARREIEQELVLVPESVTALAFQQELARRFPAEQ